MDNENTVNNEIDHEAAEDNRHQKFLDVSADTIRKAVTAIEKVGKCSNQRQFEYSEEEVEKMFAALQETLDDTRALFKTKKSFSW